MNEYIWSVWKDCRLVGYIKAYSESYAMQQAKEKYGDRIFLERTAIGQTDINCSELSSLS